MPTLYGPWEGTGSGKARIKVEYTRTYSADRTEAIFNGTVYIEADGSVSDSTNSWTVNSLDGNFSGNNLAISIGSGGGQKKIRDFGFTDQGSDSTLSASVSNIEYYGETINASFNMDNGSLAPFLNNHNYTHTSVTSNSAVITGVSGNANGSTLEYTQVQYNTSMSESGAGAPTVGYGNNLTLTGLYRATTYYYRARVSNTGYGWGAWGPWKSFTTLTSIPGAPAAYWAITSIDQTSAQISSLAVPDNGGATVDFVLARVNTSPVDAGAFDFTGVGPINMVGLTPGTLYYVRLIAHNANGYGPWTEWRTFTTLPGVSVNVGGVWKSAQPWVNVNGIWKPAVRYVNVGGVWKQ